MVTDLRLKVQHYLSIDTDAAPLAVFRILFGLLMSVSIIRFWRRGWIEKLYIEPHFHFHYYGFEWIKPLGAYTYLIFILCGLSAFCVALGYKYRLAIILFFLSFTYIELLDKTTYLNHYYFVSLVSFLLIFLPANAYFSVDAFSNKDRRFQYIRQWQVDAIKLMLGLVYFYAGLAKLNADWLFEAQPLRIWLPSKYMFPVLGGLFQKTWMAYVFSWAGILYDLSIPFLLLNRRLRPLAFLMVVVFHMLTRMLFPIGMFPYIMIVSTLIFFQPTFHHKLLKSFSGVFRINKSLFDNQRHLPGLSYPKRQTIPALFTVFFLIQLILPFRFLGYPAPLFWFEEGYRFSWRVMLMEKTGYANFKIVDKATGKYFFIDNREFLTAFQEKQMSTQPDFILEFAHFLGRYYQKKGVSQPAVYVESYVALNGKGSRKFIDPKIDLMQERQSFTHKNWVLPFHEK